MELNEKDILGIWVSASGKSVLEFLENGKFELRSKDKRGNSDSQNQTHGQFEITNSGIFLKLTPNDVNDKGEIVREYLHESPHACKANGSNPYLLDCNFDFENLDWIFQFDILIEKLSESKAIAVIGNFTICSDKIRHNSMSKIPPFEVSLSQYKNDFLNIKFVKDNEQVTFFLNEKLESTIHTSDPTEFGQKTIGFDKFSGIIKNIKVYIKPQLLIGPLLITRKSEFPYSIYQLKLPRPLLTLDLCNTLEACEFQPDENRGRTERFVDVKKNLYGRGGDQFVDEDFYKVVSFFICFVLGNSVLLYYLSPGGVGGIIGFFAWLYFFCIYWILVLVGFGFLFFLVVNFFFSKNDFSKST